MKNNECSTNHLCQHNCKERKLVEVSTVKCDTTGCFAYFQGYCNAHPESEFKTKHCRRNEK